MRKWCTPKRVHLPKTEEVTRSSLNLIQCPKCDKNVRLIESADSFYIRPHKAKDIIKCLQAESDRWIDAKGN